MRDPLDSVELSKTLELVRSKIAKYRVDKAFGERNTGSRNVP